MIWIDRTRHWQEPHMNVFTHKSTILPNIIVIKRSNECIQKWNECQQFYQTLLCYKLDKKQPIGQSDLSCDISRSEIFHFCLINSYWSTRTNMISVGRDQKNIGNGPISRSVADSAKCRVNVGFTTLLITAFFLFSNIFS